MSPLWYTTVRLIVGTATMMMFVASIKKLSWPSKKDFALIIIVGLLEISIYMLLANIGLSYLPAGRSSLLAYTTPLWIMPLVTWVFKEKSGITHWLGFILGLTGLFILLNPWESDWTNADTLFGSAMLLLASLCWAISMLACRYMKWNKPPLELISWQLLIGTLPILVFALAKEPLPTIEWNMPLVLSLVYTGVLVTGISYWGGVVLNRALPALVVSLGFLLVPVLSTTVSIFFMQEALTISTVIAMTCILLGLVFVVV